jgi:hypothetical protein
MALLRRRRKTPASAVAEGQRSWTAELPGPGDEPLLRLELEQDFRPEGDGERVHLRLRLQTRFSQLQPALAARRAPTLEALPGPEAARPVRALARRALAAPLVQRLAAPLLRYDLNTLLDVQASTASLAQGSRALMPAPERLAAVGIQPDLSPSAPPVQSWMAERPDGLLQVTLLRFDRDQLARRLRQRLADAPFAISAALIQTLERR